MKNNNQRLVSSLSAGAPGFSASSRRHLRSAPTTEQITGVDRDRGELGEWKTPYANSIIIGRGSTRVHAQTEVDWLLNLRDPDMRRTTFRANKQPVSKTQVEREEHVFRVTKKTRKFKKCGLPHKLVHKSDYAAKIGLQRDTTKIGYHAGPSSIFGGGSCICFPRMEPAPTVDLSLASLSRTPMLAMARVGDCRYGKYMGT
jgi:hypothetical protein